MAKLNQKITIPLRNYKDKRGGRVPEGTYRAVTEDAEVGESRNGDVMITLYFRVVGGEYDGTTIIDRLFPAMEKAQWRTVAFLQAAGIPTPRKDFVIELGKFVNRTMDIEVADGDPYNGVVRSEVRGYAKVAKSEQQSEADLVEDGESWGAVPLDDVVAKVSAARAAAGEDSPEPSTNGTPDDDVEDLSLEDLEEI